MFEGSDAIGGLCIYCEVNREVRIQQERVEKISTLNTKLAAAEAKNERLTRWRNLAIAAATAGAEQEVLQRFAESEAILPIIQAWKDKVAELEQRLATADKLACTVAKAIMRGEIRERSAVDDALLIYLNIGGIEGPKDVPTWIEQYERQTTCSSPNSPKSLPGSTISDPEPPPMI